MSFPIVPVLMVAAGGVAIAVQAPLNAALGRTLQSGLAAAAVSFAVGLAVLLALTFATAGTAPFARLGLVTPVLLLGGLLGAYYVWAIISSVGSLGVVTAVATLILGQLVAALVLDRIGAFGLPVHEISLQRILAVVLVAPGLVLSRA